MLPLIFLVLALVLFLLSAVGVNSPRLNLMALGLASLTAYLLIGGRL